MIELDRVTKRFGSVTALDDLSFTVRPGHVTGFLGPNGAGKTTTMKIILGLDVPTAGRALVAGRPYLQLIRPLRQIGALLDVTALHGGRTGRDHLLSVARSNGIGRHRVTEVLRLTGMEAVAGRRVKGYSLGMKQRLGLAAALLGDPPILLFDEPVNGLDTEGIHWIRQFQTTFAAVPRRRPVLAAKAAVTGAVTLVAGEVVAFVSFFIVQAVLSGHHAGVSLSRPGVPGAVLAEGILLCVCALLGVALGAIIRHTAGGIAAAIGVIVLPSVLSLLPAPWNGRLGRFTLLEAAHQVTALHPQPNLFTPALSLLVLLALPAAALLAAALLITRRDT